MTSGRAVVLDPYINLAYVLGLRCQFHQHFTGAFFVWKCFAQLFSNKSSTLWLFGKRILAQKCWWNQLKVVIVSVLLSSITSNCVTDLDLWHKMIILKPFLTTFKVAIFFEEAGSVAKNGQRLKLNCHNRA